VHYAGALYTLSLMQLQALIAKDLQQWATGLTDSQRQKHVYVSVNGGLGDQLCAEPAIRFLKEELYPNDDVVVATHWPRLFSHLTALGVTVCEQGRANLREDTPYYLATTLPGPETLQWMIVSHLLCHSTDYTAMALMKRTLPLLRKTPKFEVWPQDREALAHELNGMDPKTLVAVHPGMHWNSKTFPIPWWQEVIDGLAASGRTVAIIGKNEKTTDASIRGVLPVMVPKGGVDLRNRLSLGALAALLEVAPTLISNDSAPVHLAGCFDNEIILIPSCKHPDHILPYRHGRLDYKAVAVYKRLVIDDVESRPTQAYETSADMPHVEWDRYLPNPVDVARVTHHG
jgi:hypothetical protein